MISRTDIEKLAELSRLKLSEEEVAGLEKDFTSILGYVEQIREAGGEEKPIPEVRNVMRSDEPYGEGSLLLGKREALLKAFPEREDDYDVVRKIIEK